VGNVVTPWTRKAPGFRKRTGTGRFANRPYYEPRRLVVCGMTVMGARSWFPKAPLTTRAGRVFPAMPKSISQASPRRGVVILFLKGLEQGGGGSVDFLVFQGSGIERQGTAQHLLRKGALLFHGEVFEGVQQCFGISAHEHMIPARPRAKKKSFPQPNGR
jgi:hypothetical protein